MRLERKTWLEVITRRQLEKDATEGTVSQEQVDAAVADKKAKIRREKELEDAVFDLQYETIRQALQGKNN